MRIIWNKGESLVRDILEAMPEPQPPYTTLASTVKSLEKKGFVRHRAYGPTNLYSPKITQEEYSRKSVNSLVKNYFEGSVGNFLSFMVKEKKISDKEVEDLQKLIDDMDKQEQK